MQQGQAEAIEMSEPARVLPLARIREGLREDVCAHR